MKVFGFTLGHGAVPDRRPKDDSFAVDGDRKIWLFGPSAIGKKTLIYDLTHLANPRSCEFSKAVNLEHRKPVFPVVLDNKRAGKSQPEINEMWQARMSVFRDIYRSNFGVTWLIQGQSIDLRAPFLPRMVEEIGRKLPNSLAVYLRVSEERFESTRAKRKVENKLSYAEAYLDEEEKVQALRSVFPNVITHQAR